LKNENPDMVEADQLDIYDPEYQQKRIDIMERQMDYTKKREVEDKVGSKTFES